MAVGTIPITNYPEWMRPNLVHMENCIVFDDEADLIRKVQLALSLDKSEIARMRANVIDYYRKHLDPRIFVRGLEARPERDITVLLYTEDNVRDNWAQLDRHSVLMRHGEGNSVMPSRIVCLLHNLTSTIRKFTPWAQFFKSTKITMHISRQILWLGRVFRRQDKG
jgi:hypothetical protein